MYRAGAVGHLSSPEQLDTDVRLVRPAGSIELGAVGLVLVAFIVWGFVGTPKTTDGPPSKPPAWLGLSISRCWRWCQVRVPVVAGSERRSGAAMGEGS
jgi:hypothetical protein